MKGLTLFAVISDVPKDVALELCKRLAPNRRVNNGEGGQEAYLAARHETEDWLRESAQAVGVDMLKNNPIYFTLTKESQEGLAPAGRKAISIPAETLDLNYCSFTYGDSMSANAPGPGYPFKGIVLNTQQADKAVKIMGIDGDYIKGGRYFEVQMWARSADITIGRQAKSVPQPRRNRAYAL